MASFALEDVLAEIDKQAAAFGVNPRTAKALAVAENTDSGSLSKKTVYRGDAVSPVGASGVMQVMPATARGLQQAGFLPASWKHDPEDLPSQIQAGLAALKEKLGRMNNPDDLGEIASVYNGSSKTHRAYKAGRLNELPAETQHYITKLRRADMELGGTQGNNPSAYVPPSDPSVAQTPGRSTVRRTVNDPLQLDSFMSEVMNAVRPGGAFDITAGAVADAGAERALLSQDVVNAVTAKGAAAGAEATAIATHQAAGEARRAQILTSLNLNPDATDNRMMQAMSVIDRTEQALSPMKAEIDQRMAVGFFDNPLEWLVNQTRLPGMVEQYNGIVGVQKNAKDSFATAASIASTQQSISSSMDADLILAKGKATTERVAADAVEAAAKVKMETAGAASREALTTMQLLGQKIGLQGQALQVTRQTVSESTGESDRAKAAKAEEESLANVNKVLVAAGGNPIPSVLQFKQLPTAKKEVLLSAATSGKFGKNFAESFELLYNDGNRDKVARGGGATVVHWVNGTAGAAGNVVQQEMLTAEKMKQKYDPKKHLPEELNKLQNQYEAQAAVDMRSASEYNPFKLDYQTVSKLPELQTNAVAAWINKYGPKGTEPTMGKVDEQFIVQKFAEAIRTGAMTAPMAAKEIANYYQVATAKQAELTQYSLFGMSKPEKTYAVKLKDSKAPVDLGNATQVENMLTTKVAAEARAAMLNAFTGGAGEANPFGSWR